MPTTYTYTPGMTLDEFLAANGYDKNKDPLSTYYGMRDAFYGYQREGGEVDASGDAGRGGRGGTRSGGPGGGPRDTSIRPDPTYIPPSGKGAGAGDAATTGAAGMLQAMFDRLSDPTFGVDFYSRLVQNATPSYDQYMKRVNALGGSAVQANEQHQAAEREAQGQGFNAFSQFRLGTDQLQAGIAGDLLANEEYMAGLEHQGDQAAKDRQSSFINSVLSGIFGVGGIYLGNKYGNPQNNQGGYGGFPNPYGGYGGSLGTGGTGSPGYPTYRMDATPTAMPAPSTGLSAGGTAPGGLHGGTQQPGRQQMQRPPGPNGQRRNPYAFLGY